MPDLRKLAIGVGQRLYEAVHPRIGRVEAGGISGEAKSGDYTYAIDAVAEEMLERVVDEAGSAAEVRLALYSEDRGLVPVHSEPEFVLVIDPIDGTRPAICGLESCCASVAVARLNSGHATLGDVEAAALVELKS